MFTTYCTWCLCSSSSMHAATQKVVQWRGYPLYCMTGLTSRLFLSGPLAVISPPHAQHDLVPGPSELVCLMGLTLPHVQHVLCLGPLSSAALGDASHMMSVDTPQNSLRSTHDVSKGHYTVLKMTVSQNNSAATGVIPSGCWENIFHNSKQLGQS